MRNHLFFLPAIAILILTSVSVADYQWPAVRQVDGLYQGALNSAASGATFSGWQAAFSPELNAPVVAWGAPVAVSDDRTALDMIRSAAGTTAEFESTTENRAGSLRRVFYEEVRGGFPVIGGRIDWTLNARGEMMRWSARSHDSFEVRDAHLLDAQTCADFLASQRRLDYHEIMRSNAKWYPDLDARKLIPVYWMRISGPEPHERWEGIVNAVSGEIIVDWPGVESVEVAGTVSGPYWQPYIQSDVQFANQPFAAVFVDSQLVFTDAQGHYTVEANSPSVISARLRGPYVYVDNEDAPGSADLQRQLTPPFSPTNLEWTTGEASAPELNLFYHTTFIHSWYKILDSQFSALDYPLPAIANVGSSYDNAYWNGYGTYYGSGQTYQNFAMFSDVIYHEYTHGVTDGIYPDGMLPYIDQPGAMNEAWSDYIACTINGDPLMAEYMLPNNPYSAFRDLENDLVYPQDWFGEVHSDSRFVSGALWRIRAAMGADFTDWLAHYARYGLSETFFDYLVSVLETDDDDGDLSNGTPNAVVIYQSFGIHGIGPGEDPHFGVVNLEYFADGTQGSIGDGDRHMEQGETVALRFVLQNQAVLFPPPAMNVSVTVSTTDNNPAVQVQNPTTTFESIPAGDERNVGIVLIQLGGTTDFWATMRIHVTANGGESQFDHDFEFTVGTPHVLIVADDPTSDVEHFVTDVVREQGRIFEVTEPGENSLALDMIPNYGLILWLSGNAAGEVLTQQDRNQLRAFLERGNKIVLSGQNIVDEPRESDFAQYTLFVHVLEDSNGSNSVTAAGEPLPEDSWYLITGARGAANQRTPSSFEIYASTHSIGHYGRASEGPCSIAEFYNGNGLLFGFGLEAVSGMAGSEDLPTLMNSIYDWADTLLAVESEPMSPAIVRDLALESIFPNPFNGQTSIRYSIPAGPTATLSFFDVLGRAIESHDLASGAGVFHWAPRIGSGVYFAQLRSATGASRPAKVMLIK